MKIKSKDIAAALGLSTATVSLALNNKPGVNSDTRKKILNYLNELEKASGSGRSAGPADKYIMIIFYQKHGHILGDANCNFFSDMLVEACRIMEAHGFSTAVTYFYEQSDSIYPLIKRCQEENVAGVLLIATEMVYGDFEPFRKISVPILIYDNYFEDVYHDYVNLNNRQFVRLAIRCLTERGHTRIMYLAHDTKVYNFEERRSEFWEFAQKLSLDRPQENILSLGYNVRDAYEQMMAWLKNSPALPTAFICESYMISIGIMNALKEMNIRVPEDISVIGINKIPSYGMLDKKVTYIKEFNKRRGNLAAHLLIERIKNSVDDSMDARLNGKLVSGATVKSVN